MKKLTPKEFRAQLAIKVIKVIAFFYFDFLVKI